MCALVFILPNPYIFPTSYSYHQHPLSVCGFFFPLGPAVGVSPLSPFAVPFVLLNIYPFCVLALPRVLTLYLIIKLCPTSGDIRDQISPNIPILHCFPKLQKRQLGAAFTPFTQHIIWGLPLLPSTTPSMVYFTGRSISACTMCPKYDCFCFSISAAHGHGGLIYSRTDLFVLLAVLGILIIHLQHQISKLSIFFLCLFSLSMAHINTL